MINKKALPQNRQYARDCQPQIRFTSRIFSFDAGVIVSYLAPRLKCSNDTDDGLICNTPSKMSFWKNLFQHRVKLQKWKAYSMRKKIPPE